MEQGNPDPSFTPKLSLQPGYFVSLTLKPDTAPLRCYVGLVEVVDERGVLLSLIDWLIGGFTTWDFFAPWDSITSALIATPAHDWERFGEAAAKWQTQMGERARVERPIDRGGDELP